MALASQGMGLVVREGPCGSATAGAKINKPISQTTGVMNLFRGIVFIR